MSCSCANEVMLMADGIWPPLYSYGKRQSSIITSSNIVLNGGRLLGGGLGVEHVEIDEQDEDGEEAADEEEQDVSASHGMMLPSWLGSLSSSICCVRRLDSSRPRSSSATVAQLTIATPSAVLPLSGSLPRPSQRAVGGEVGGEGVGEGEEDG